MKRLGIYFFFDKDGIVDKYVDYVLEDLTKHVDKLTDRKQFRPIASTK